MITRSANRRTAGALLGVLLVASGCASSTISQATVPDTALSSEAAASATLSTAPSTEVTLTSPPTESPIPQASAGGVAVDAVAATSVDGLRVRSQPRVAGDSLKLEPLLPLGAPVFVLDGPVSASGYSWYEVAPLGSRTLPQGWVAAGSRTGEPWLAPGTFVCPPVPHRLQVSLGSPACRWASVLSGDPDHSRGSSHRVQLRHRWRLVYAGVVLLGNRRS